jgi:hypothetical protein
MPHELGVFQTCYLPGVGIPLVICATVNHARNRSPRQTVFVFMDHPAPGPAQAYTLSFFPKQDVSNLGEEASIIRRLS